MTPFKITRGDGPLILAQPHGGVFVPDEIAARLNGRGRGLDDADWHINRLYDGLLEGVSVVEATFHRYVIDANRDPDGASLYPGQNTTTLCPTTDFDGRDIWQEGQAPGPDEIEERRLAYHAPYHAALAGQIERTKARHGFAVLYDCHSIRSEIPFLFAGTLPVFNIGSNNGATCDATVEQAVMDVVSAANGYDHVLNGRFTGGWTTRHYGQPQSGCHAIQMELAQRAYMDEAPPWDLRNDRAAKLRPHLSAILKNLTNLALSGALAQGNQHA